MTDVLDLQTWTFGYRGRTGWTVEGNDGGLVRSMGRRGNHWWQGTDPQDEVPSVQVLGSTAFVRGTCTSAAFAYRVSHSRMERAMVESLKPGGWVRTTTRQLRRDASSVLPGACVESLLQDERLDYSRAKWTGDSTKEWLTWDMPGTSPWQVRQATGELLVDDLFGGRFRLHFHESKVPSLPVEWVEAQTLQVQFGLELELPGAGGEDHAIRMTFSPIDLHDLMAALEGLADVDGPVDDDDVLSVYLYADDLDAAWQRIRPLLLASLIKPLEIVRVFPSGERAIQDSELLAVTDAEGSRH